MVSHKDNDFGPKGIDQGTSNDYLRGLTQMAKPRSRAGSRAAQLLVYTIMFLLIALNVLNFSIANGNRALGNDLRDQLSATYNPSFKVRYESLGAEIIKAWYNPSIQTSPIAIGAGITWPVSSAGSDASVPVDENESNDTTNTATVSSDRINPISVTSVAFLSGQQLKTPGKTPNAYQEQLTYSAYINGSYYQISITVGILDLSDSKQQPVLISSPTISSQIQIPIDTTNPAGVPTDWQKFDAQDGLKTAVNSWAKSWSTNDSVALKQVTGDSSGDTYYAGLTPGSWEYLEITLQILWAYQRPNTASEIAVQVQWNVKLPDLTVPDPTNPQIDILLTGATQTQRMDLLVKDADSGLPKIIAWGPAGTYPALQDKQNVLTKIQYDALPKTTPIEEIK